VIDGILGIDVSKNTLDASMSSCNKVRAKSFANSPDGWRHLLVRSQRETLASLGSHQANEPRMPIFQCANKPGRSRDSRSRTRPALALRPTKRLNFRIIQASIV
jgi:hypothetical protein